MQINNIIDKINLIDQPTELAKHEVELSIKDDITKIISDYEVSSKKLDGELVNFYNNVFAAKKSFEGLKSDADRWFAFQKQFKAEKDKAIALGKDLGIDVTGAPFYKELLAALNRFDDLYTEFSAANLTYKSIKI